MCRMRLRAGRCLATVRLLVAATAAQTFASVAAAGSHVLGADGARDRDPRITGFIRTCGRLVEELRPLLPPHCQRYVFADLPRVAYQCLMWTVPRVEVVNSIGLERLLQCASPSPSCTLRSRTLCPCQLLSGVKRPDHGCLHLAHGTSHDTLAPHIGKQNGCVCGAQASNVKSAATWTLPRHP